MAVKKKKPSSGKTLKKPKPASGKKKNKVKKKTIRKKPAAIKRKVPVKKKKPAGRKKPVRRKKPSIKKLPAAGKKTAKVKTIKPIGTVTHYFPRVRAAAVKMNSALSSGENIKIKGHNTEFFQRINSMEIDRVPITKAKKGQVIGLLVDKRVRKNDLIYRA